MDVKGRSEKTAVDLNAVKFVAVSADGALPDLNARKCWQIRSSVTRLFRLGVTVSLFGSGVPLSIRRAARKLGMCGPVIACHGAGILFSDADQDRHRVFIDKRTCLEVLEECERASVAYAVVLEDRVVANSTWFRVFRSKSAPYPFFRPTAIVDERQARSYTGLALQVVVAFCGPAYAVVAERLKVPMEAVAVVGGSDSDVDMLEVNFPYTKLNNL